MSSAIDTIYNELAATTITVGGITISVKDADELPDKIHRTDCPVRVLTPIYQFGGGVEEFSHGETIWQAASGSSPKYVDWTIYDVLLWKPVAASIGAKAWAKELVLYCREYYDMISTLALTNVQRVDTYVSPLIIEYPLYTGNYFSGARSTLRMREKWG